MSNDSSAVLPASVQHVVLNTGNILGCKDLTKKVFQSLGEELIQSLTLALVKWKSSSNHVICVDGKVLHYVNKDLPCQVAVNERSTFKITVKVFLGGFDETALEKATNKVLEELAVSELDSLIVAFPPVSAKSSTELMRPLWAAAEHLYRRGLALSVGVSDLDTTQLRDLYSWADVKPSVNQVNLDSCCVIPQEMQEFAKANNIQLLTHSDPKVLLDHDGMARLLKGYVVDDDISHWSSPWVARYSVLVKCRGFLQSKGYVASLVRKLQ
ncbi:glutamate-cysteine ligase modifier subunit isoform X1 [Amblyomma americanum]|uniref:GCS light chain n=1 Tax=Amblyomma americanum TaxID=6943 RepID=A0AAQ4EUY0_AMBAM